MAFVGRRRTRDSVDSSKIRPRVSSTLSLLFSKARRISVEPSRPATSEETSFHRWLAQYSPDPPITSPTPSFEIRRPSGLGPRSNSLGSVSSLGTIHRAVVVDIGPTRPGYHRRRSVSEPNLLHFPEDPMDVRLTTVLTSMCQTPFVCETRSDSVSMLYPPSSVRTNAITSKIWGNVAQFLPRRDLSTLARVSSNTLPPARNAMYETIDLQSILPNAVRLCIGSLASYPELALLVRTFRSSMLPSFSDQNGQLPSLSFAFALCNMKNLVSLSLPRFDDCLFHYTTFRLKHLSLGSETMTVLDQEHFLNWLSTQPDIAFLSLPTLTTEIKQISCIPVQYPPVSGHTSLKRVHPTTSRLPSSSAPNLQKFDGPISLVQRLIPGRPVSEVTVHVDKTLYDGLKPSQLMDSIANSSAPIEKLSIRSSPSPVVDARTMERLLMSAGAKFGPSVLHLEIGWATEDETLYQRMLSIIPRFSSLRTLNCVPVLPLSKATTFATVDQDLLTSPVTPPPNLLSFPQLSYPGVTSTPRLLSFPLPTPSDCGASDASRARERQLIKSWVKACPSLTTITFLCGAEWCVIRRKRRVSMKGTTRTGIADEPLMCVPSFVRWRRV